MTKTDGPEVVSGGNTIGPAKFRLSWRFQVVFAVVVAIALLLEQFGGSQKAPLGEPEGLTLLKRQVRSVTVITEEVSAALRDPENGVLVQSLTSEILTVIKLQQDLIEQTYAAISKLEGLEMLRQKMLDRGADFAAANKAVSDACPVIDKEKLQQYRNTAESLMQRLVPNWQGFKLPP